jgi:hypothetical protein
MKVRDIMPCVFCEVLRRFQYLNYGALNVTMTDELLRIWMETVFVWWKNYPDIYSEKKAKSTKRKLRTVDLPAKILTSIPGINVSYKSIIFGL